MLYKYHAWPKNGQFAMRVSCSWSLVIRFAVLFIPCVLPSSNPSSYRSCWGFQHNTTISIRPGYSLQVRHKPGHMASPGFPLLSRSPSAEIVCSATFRRKVIKRKSAPKTTSNAKRETRNERQTKEYHLHHSHKKACFSPSAMITATDEPHPGSTTSLSYSIF